MCLHKAEREKEASSCISSYKVLIPLQGPHPHDLIKPDYLSKIPSPNTITLKDRLQHMN